MSATTNVYITDLHPGTWFSHPVHGTPVQLMCRPVTSRRRWRRTMTAVCPLVRKSDREALLDAPWGASSVGDALDSGEAVALFTYQAQGFPLAVARRTVVPLSASGDVA